MKEDNDNIGALLIGRSAGVPRKLRPLPGANLEQESGKE